MPNKCSAPGCFTNYKDHDKGAVFRLPKDEDTRNSWIKFINRKDLSSIKNIFLCEKHFEKSFLCYNNKRIRLKDSMKPVPTIFTDSQASLPTSCLPIVKKHRKLPTERVYQPDQLEDFRNKDRIMDFSDINESLVKYIGADFTFVKYDDYAVYYRIRENYSSAPVIAECIRINSDLHVKLFYRGCPVPLPQWFVKDKSVTVKSKSCLENFLPHIRSEAEKNYDILEEMRQLKYQKRPVYSANLIRYALLLRHTSLASYKLMLNEFKLPSISLLRRITCGKIDVYEAAKKLKENGNISEDIVLLFDEIHLQKSEEYVGGDSVGADKSGSLYKGVVCFMIVGLKSNIPYLVKTCPETTLNGEWLKDNLLQCIKELQENDFNIRGIVCDNHSSNVAAYQKLFKECNNDPDNLFITLNDKKIYLFYDSVHLIKNIRNNLLQRKRFIFPDFFFNKLHDEIKFSSGEIRWKLFHDVYEKDCSLDANMKAAQMLNANALHPGNCKQSVPPALAIFHPTTSAAIETYFPDQKNAADFLKLINTWWTVSNSKHRFNTRHRIGNAAVDGDNKPEFLREIADWIERWDAMKIPSSEFFTLSAQTSAALRTTLRCHANLIEDLLSEGYDFVLTSRFQSDPIERRFSQYRQMSGGRFLISLKDILCSENILKIRSLVKEGFDITPEVKYTFDETHHLEDLHSQANSLLNIENFHLSDASKEVSDHIAGYIANKAKKICVNCCYDELLDTEEDSATCAYIRTLSRGGLKIPSEKLRNSVAQGFACLDICSEIIRESPVPSRKAGEYILKMSIDTGVTTCSTHEEQISRSLIRTVTNIFFNNQRKRKNETIVKDRVADFKRNKRAK